HRVGTTLQHAIDQVLEVTDATRGDHRHRHRITDRPRERNVETILCAVTVHAGQQDFTRAVVRHAGGPLDRIDAGRLAAAVGEDFPAVWFTLGADLLRVDGHHDALRAETVGRLAHEVRIADGGRIDAYLVRAGIEQVADVGDRAHTAANGQRDEYLAGHALHRMQHGVAAFMAGGNIQEGNLVGAGLVIAARDLHRIAGVANLDELDALDDTTLVHVQAGNNAFGQTHDNTTAVSEGTDSTRDRVSANPAR